MKKTDMSMTTRVIIFSLNFLATFSSGQTDPCLKCAALYNWERENLASSASNLYGGHHFWTINLSALKPVSIGNSYACEEQKVLILNVPTFRMKVFTGLWHVPVWKDALFWALQ